jgi:hypothetical protein
MSGSTQFIENILGNELYQQLTRSNREAVQGLLQAKLRELAIHHLRTANTPLARSFRGEYSAIAGAGAFSAQTWNQYLDLQSKNGAWGHEIEFAALGELFGVDVVVTNERYETWCPYRASSDTEAKPMIHLYNQSNTHWSVPGGTRGDGNCLYNAFAQALFAEVKPVIAHEEAAPESASAVRAVSTLQTSTTFTFFSNTAEEKKAIELQQSIEQAIAKQRAPNQITKDFEAECARIERLSPAEQQQIAEDHRLALKLAMEENEASVQKSTDFIRCLIPESGHISTPRAAAAA